jgi:KipI family sensor histidine kinase inhibitor
MSTDASKLRILPAGDRALLLTPGDREDLDGLVDLLRGADLTGMQDLLPAAETVLVTLAAGADAETVERELRQLLATAPTTRSGSEDTGDPLIIPVRYDGADLDDVARLLDISVEELVARHTGRIWRCRFIGFTAGFGYLASPGWGLSVPRRQQSRASVPPGSVGLADGYSAVYPRRAPGGWQLIGSTDVPMWDLGRPRPALLSPGTLVRFVAAGR